VAPADSMTGLGEDSPDAAVVLDPSYGRKVELVHREIPFVWIIKSDINLEACRVAWSRDDKHLVPCDSLTCFDGEGAESPASGLYGVLPQIIEHAPHVQRVLVIGLPLGEQLSDIAIASLGFEYGGRTMDGSIIKRKTNG
jgi:hypothetical protein